MKLSLVITQNCSTCLRAEKAVRDIKINHTEISFNIVNVNDYKGKAIMIVPALLIDDELFSYGDIDEVKLLSRISEQQHLTKSI
jgi:alkyl hydroperoxide reductase subunit AhpF